MKPSSSGGKMFPLDTFSAKAMKSLYGVLASGAGAKTGSKACVDKGPLSVKRAASGSIGLK